MTPKATEISHALLAVISERAFVEIRRILSGETGSNLSMSDFLFGSWCTCLTRAPGLFVERAWFTTALAPTVPSTAFSANDRARRPRGVNRWAPLMLGADMSSQPPDPDPATAPRRVRVLRADARRNRERVLRTVRRLFGTEGLTAQAEALAATEFDLRTAGPAEWQAASNLRRVAGACLVRPQVMVGCETRSTCRRPGRQ
ncbi:hypothetical protein GCM10010402_16250 [Actinomadura luteofluorescens]